MARDRQTEELLREALLAALPRGTQLAERPMFGAQGFLLHGNLIGAASDRGVMLRVGKDAMPDALDLAGVGPMEMSGRTMGGFVRADETAHDDPDTLSRLTALAAAATLSLPPK